MISVLYLYVCVAWSGDLCAGYEPYRKLATIIGPNAPTTCDELRGQLEAAIPEHLQQKALVGCESGTMENHEDEPEPSAAPTRAPALRNVSF